MFDALKDTELTALILKRCKPSSYRSSGSSVEFLHVFLGHVSHALEETQNILFSSVSVHLLVHDCPALIAYQSVVKANYASDL